VHALKELLALPVQDRPRFLYNADYQVPVNIYTESLPDGLAIRYGRLMNELQSVAFNANFLDDARYITNIRKTIKCEGENTEEKAFQLVNKAISINASKFKILTQKGMAEARSTFSDEYVKRLIAMKSSLGNACFDYAEGLQEMNTTALIDQLHLSDEDMIQRDSKGNLPKYSEDCFVPHTQAIVRIGYKKLAKAYAEAHFQEGDPDIGNIVFGFMYAWYLITGTRIERHVFQNLLAGFLVDLKFETSKKDIGGEVFEFHMETPCPLRIAVMDHVLIKAFANGIPIYLLLMCRMHVVAYVYICICFGCGLNHTRRTMCM
jgi:hypothetical protein